jgi:histidinol-phosphate aminotransferase
MLSCWEGELLPNAFAQPEEHTSLKEPSSAKVLPIRILFNENPLGCSPQVRIAIDEALARSNFYPLEQAGLLVDKLRMKHGLPILPRAKGLSLKPASDDLDHTLVLGGGSSELLLAAAHAFSVEGGNVVEPALTYQTVGNTAKTRPGPSVERRQIALRTDGNIDVDAMLAACDSKTRIVVLTNPNNPTGGSIPLADVQKLATHTPAQALVIVDEAYIDFLDQPENRTAIPIALQSERILVTRTFSKIHGLAGLRCGYAIGHKSIFARMQPYQVGSLSLNLCGLVAARAALDDTAFQDASRVMASESRKRISEQLAALGFQVAKSDAACVWAAWNRNALPLVERLAERGVMISTGLRWNAENCIRVSIGTPWQTTKLLEELTSTVQSMA